MRTVGSHSTSGRVKEGKKERIRPRYLSYRILSHLIYALCILTDKVCKLIELNEIYGMTPSKVKNLIIM